MQTSFISTFERATSDDRTYFDRLAKIYEANDYEDEPSLEYLAVLLMSVIDGLEGRITRFVDNVHNIIDHAIPVAMSASSGVDELGEIALVGRDPTSFEYIRICILIANHHIDAKNYTAARQWLNRLDGSSLSQIQSRIVERFKGLCE